MLCVGSAAAMTGGGTASNPYKLYNQADLALLSGSGYASYVGTGKYFELGADITMSGTFTPIGNSSYKFNGHFDGKGHSITNMQISGGNYLGLFSYVTSGAYMANIQFYNAQITASNYIGVLYGYGLGSSTKITVTNVNVYNSVVSSNGYQVGGIVGHAAGSSDTVEFTSCNVENCLIYTSNNSVGGIAGHAMDPSSTVKFTSCNVKSSIVYSSGSVNVGGIVGHGAYTNGTVIAQGCTVENCYVYSKVNRAGGIIGRATYNSGSQCTITNCRVLKSTIRVDGNYAGGIYGSHSSGEPVVSGCEVSDCTVIAASGGGGITGGSG